MNCRIRSGCWCVGGNRSRCNLRIRIRNLVPLHCLTVKFLCCNSVKFFNFRIRRRQCFAEWKSIGIPGTDIAEKFTIHKSCCGGFRKFGEFTLLNFGNFGTKRKQQSDKTDQQKNENEQYYCDFHKFFTNGILFCIIIIVSH